MKKDRIQKLIDYKGFTKEQLEIAVKISKEALEIESAKLDCTVSILDRTVEEFSRKQGGPSIDAQELDYYYNYFAYLTRQIDEQKQTVTEKITEVERRQKALMKAHRDKRLCEILRDKITGEQAREAGKNEQKEADFKFISRRLKT